MCSLLLCSDMSIIMFINIIFFSLNFVLIVVIFVALKHVFLSFFCTKFSINSFLSVSHDKQKDCLLFGASTFLLAMQRIYENTIKKKKLSNWKKKYRANLSNQLKSIQCASNFFVRWFFFIFQYYALLYIHAHNYKNIRKKSPAFSLHLFTFDLLIVTIWFRLELKKRVLNNFFFFVDFLILFLLSISCNH